MQVFAFIGDESRMISGLGATAFIFGIAIEIIGYAIYDEHENPHKK